MLQSLTTGENQGKCINSYFNKALRTIPEGFCL